MGSLSPSQFLYEGATITVIGLAYEGDPGDTVLTLEFTGSLGSSDYTLELDAESFTLSGTDGSGYLNVTASPTFVDGETVAVKLFEGSGGGTLSDDATLTSLEFHAGNGIDEELFTLTPAFDAETTEYTAVVGSGFGFALIKNIVRGHSGASVVVTDAFASYDLGTTEDAAGGLFLGVGENTFTVEVAASDGNTIITYTLVVTRTVTPPAHCETGDVWCATLRVGTVTEAVGTVSDGEYGYSGAHGTLSHVAFEHDGTAYEVDALYHRVVYGVGTPTPPPLRPLRIEFDPSGETVFNTDDLVLYIDGTAFAFSDATFTSTYFEWSNSDLSWTSTDTVEVRLESGTAGMVPSDWSLLPAGLTAGDQFRLIFLSQTRRAGSASDIAGYNTFIQTLAAAGHTDIQAYRDGFTVVGCTADADAVDNTGTTGVGVPIYWLNGAKVADDYADFYDGDWDEEAVNKNELGENGRNTSNSNNYPWTGCDHDGTEAFTSAPQSEALGTSSGFVRVGRPNSTTTGHGPLSSGTAELLSDTRPMYGLSAVFEVLDTTAPSPESADVRDAGTSLSVTFDEDLDTAEFLPTAVVDAFTLTADDVDLDIGAISAGGLGILNIFLPTGTIIYQNQTVTISYDQTAAGTDALEDAAGNEVASFTDFAVTNDSVVERGRLSVRLQNLPSSHDGNTAFTVNLRFNKDISDDSIDNLDEAIVITNGTKNTPAAVGSSKRNFTMTITPSSGDPVRIRVRKSADCTTRSYSICTDARQVLDRGLSRWVTTTDEARLRALWLTRKYGSWVGGVRSGTYGYSGRVDLSVSELTMHVATYASGVTIAVTGPAGTFTASNRWDGGKTVQLDLPEGSTTWTVTVTSPDNSETLTYLVTVSRSAPGPADVRLKTLTVTPVNGTLLSFNPSFHLGTQASTFQIRVSSGTTAVRLSVEKNSPDPDVRLMRHETRTLDDLGDDPDLPGVQFSLHMGQRLYRPIWVIGPNDTRKFNRRVYQLWITKSRGTSMATEAEPLQAAFENPPSSHDGSSAFTLRIAFSEDVEITPEDMRDHALTVLGGTVTAAEQVEGLKTLWDLTIQPSGNGSVFILTPLNRACTEAGALCNADGGTLTVAPALQIAGPPPPQVNNPATGAPTVTGTAQVGETLTADTSGIADADGLANVSYSYQWLRNDGTSDTDITGETDSTHSLVDADEGKTVKVKVSFTDDAGSNESLTSPATATVDTRPIQGSTPDTPDQPNGTAVFVGGVDLEWNDVPGADSYDVQLFRNGQWMELPGDDVEIAFYGAGAIISELDPGSSHWFQVRAGNAHGSSDWSDFRQVGSTNQTTSGKRARPDNVTASGAPVINGTAQVGESLTADAAGIADGNGLDRVQFRFQWVSNDGSADAVITGATGSSYTLVGADEGKTVKVRVSFTDRGGYAESLTSAATDTVSFAVQQQVANSPATGAPAITGTAQVGETLTVDTSGIADADGLTNVTYGYQWVANDGSSDTDITGETDSTYTLVAAEEGKTIKVRVSFTDRGGYAESLTSAATAAVDAASNSPATGAPSISGTAQVGETLTADTAGIADADGMTKANFIYSWNAGERHIQGATGVSYTLTQDQEGQTMQVLVAYVDDNGNSEVLASEKSDPVEAKAPNNPATGAPTISGTPQVGQTLTADASAIADEDELTHVTYGYQWVANDETSDANIPGATDFTYTLTADDEGRTIKVRVSFTDDAANSESLTSAATATVDAAPNSPATGAPSISGTVQVAETLTVDTSGIADADGLTNVSYSYQWVANDGTSDADILNATESSYTLAAADEGKTVKVRLSFTDDAGNGETLTSAATATVDAAPNSPATGAPTVTGTAQVGETLTANTSGIADADGRDGAAFAYQWIAGGSDIDGATSSSYTLTAAEEGLTIQVWVSFNDDKGNPEALTSEATTAVVPRPPLTVSLENSPQGHNGTDEFTFEIRFREEFKLSYRTLKSHAFNVTGGEVLKAQRTDKPSNMPWRITVRPDSNGDVTVVLPVTTDCDAQGAICTEDGRKLSNSLNFTVSGLVG